MDIGYREVRYWKVEAILHIPCYVVKAGVNMCLNINR